MSGALGLTPAVPSGHRACALLDLPDTVLLEIMAAASTVTLERGVAGWTDGTRVWDGAAALGATCRRLNRLYRYDFVTHTFLWRTSGDGPGLHDVTRLLSRYTRARTLLLWACDRLAGWMDDMLRQCGEYRAHGLLEVSMHKLKARDEDVEAVVRLCPRLRSLVVNGPEAEFGDRAVDAIVQHASPDLKVLRLSATKITDASLVGLSSLHGLTALALEDFMHLTEDGFRSLSALENLKELWLSSTTASRHVVTDDLVETLLQHMRYLETLSLTKCRALTKRVLYACPPTLETLRINSTRILKYSLDESAFRHLQNLKCLQGYVTDRCFNPTLCYLAPIVSGLREVHLYGNLIADSAISTIAKMEELRDLALYGYCKISDTAATDLANLPRLERLTVRSRAISRDGLAAFLQGRARHSLKKIFLRCCKPGKEYIGGHPPDEPLEEVLTALRSTAGIQVVVSESWRSW